MAKQRIIHQPDMPLATLGVSSARPSPWEASDTSSRPPAQEMPAAAVERAHGDGRIQSLPVARLRASPHNSRRIRPQKRIDKVADSLKRDGQKDPIYVYPATGEDEGCYLVLGGETRRLAALQIGLTELDAVVDRALDSSDALRLTKISKILNDSLDECDLDRAMVAISLIDKGYSQHQVAEALDVESRAHVQRLLKLAGLPKSFLDFGQSYPDRFSAAVGGYIAQALDRHGDDFAFSLLRAALIDQMPHRKIAQLAESGREEGDQGKRLRRDAGFDIPVPNSLGGKYVMYRSPKQGQMVLKLSVELPENLAQQLNSELSDVLQRFIDKNNKQ